VRDQALLDRITVDPAVCSGKPCIRGAQVCVSLVLEELANGLTAAEVITRHPGITDADVRACLAYASQILHLLEPGSTHPPPSR
jgi:uncharacterized protein (DUF433 family)